MTLPPNEAETALFAIAMERVHNSVALLTEAQAQLVGQVCGAAAPSEVRQNRLLKIMLMAMIHYGDRIADQIGETDIEPLRARAKEMNGAIQSEFKKLQN